MYLFYLHVIIAVIIIFFERVDSDCFLFSYSLGVIVSCFFYLLPSVISFNKKKGEEQNEF